MTFKILDAHAHIFPEALATKAATAIGNFYGIPMYASGTPENLLEQGGKIGVNDYFVHSVATTPAQVTHINDFIHSQVLLHPEFHGFAALHPDMDDYEAELCRVEELGFKGIKLHPDFQRFQLDVPKTVAMFKRIAAHRLPALIHTGDARYDYSGPVRMANLLDKVPDLIAIGAHFGGYSEWDGVKRHLIGSNMYMDTCSSLFKLTPEEAAEMIHAHGADKFLFGTDYPMWDHENELARFMALPLTDDERGAILYGNAAKLINI